MGGVATHVLSRSDAERLTEKFKEAIAGFNQAIADKNSAESEYSAKFSQGKKSDKHRFVYLIQAGDSGPIKIGSAFSPESRLKELQTSSPYELHLRMSFPGGFEKEYELHERFNAFRLHGEWFSYEREIIEAIRLEAESCKK